MYSNYCVIHNYSLYELHDYKLSDLRNEVRLSYRWENGNNYGFGKYNLRTRDNKLIILYKKRMGINVSSTFIEFC